MIYTSIQDLLDTDIELPPPDLTVSGVGEEIQASDQTATDMYESIFAGITHYDLSRAVLEIQSGSSIEHAAALAGYVDVQTASPTNGVALFGLGKASVDGANVWGINTLLQDADTRAISAGVNRKLVNELDFNVMSPNTEVIGLSVGGNSLSQPTTANAFIANVLGTGITWGSAFWSIDGAADNAFIAGAAAAAGTDIDSQPFLLQYLDGAGTKQTVTLLVDAFGGTGFITLSGSGTELFKLSAMDLLLDDTRGIVIDGTTILTRNNVGNVVTLAAPTGENIALAINGGNEFIVNAANVLVKDGINMPFGTTTGTKIATAANQKMGKWGVTPIVQPANANQAALTNSTGGAYDGTLQAIAGSGADAAINNNFTDLFTLLDEIRNVLVTTGEMKGSA